MTNKKVIREHHQVLESTQERAKALAASLTLNHYCLVTADRQTHGRGTHGKPWVSPPHVNLYATYAFPFPRAQSHLLIHIPQVIAYSILQTLHSYGIDAKFKWVNDVLVNYKKIAGVLCETEHPNHLKDHDAVFAGMGINVNLDQVSCDAFDQPVTSLLVELGEIIDRDLLLTRLTANLLENIDQLIQYGFSPFLDIIANHMEYLGKTIKIQLHDKNKTVKEGILLGLNEEGMLLLQVNDKIEKMISGSIIVL